MIGAKVAELATPTSRPWARVNCQRLVAWLAPISPAPSSSVPDSTTIRVPNRSDSAPQKNAASPIARKSIVAAADTPLRDLLGKVGRGEPTRLPVYGEDLDNVIGMLHVVELVNALGGSDAAATAGSLAREVLTVPVTLGANDLLAEMRRRKAREALVIDEHGGTAGMVTFESLMERIIGVLLQDLRDED